jgi:uncharacterized membrane-anchored protein YjiN (DUF445 family)
MATIFAATHAVPDTTGVRLPSSMVEAGIVGEICPAISACVADVITGWETAQLNARFEADITPKLRGICVNGAVLGAFIGGGIVGLNMLLG